MRAMQEARNTAYKGVVKPVEGTILTVLKDMTTGAEEAVKQNASLSEMLLRIVEAGDEACKHTRTFTGTETGWGGGLRRHRALFHFEGMLKMLNGESLDASGAV